MVEDHYDDVDVEAEWDDEQHGGDWYEARWEEWEDCRILHSMGGSNTITKKRRMIAMVIEVTQGHIDAALEEGMRDICIDCPVARAIQEATGFEDFAVGNSMAFRDDKPGEVELPEAVQDFISRFDGDRSVEPISFDLEVPESMN